MNESQQSPRTLEGSRQDEELVGRCRHGDENAWAELIDKYKNLIYSIPIKYGFARDDANEIFQAVCLTLLSELSSLREPRALPAWLIKTTSRRCVRFRKEERHTSDPKPTELEPPANESDIPELLIRQLEQEQIVRDALNDVGPVCRQIIELLFYREPPVSYDEAASLLGMAKGSMGATRMRCLDKLRRQLENRGLR